MRLCITQWYKLWTIRNILSHVDLLWVNRFVNYDVRLISRLLVHSFHLISAFSWSENTLIKWKEWSNGLTVDVIVSVSVIDVVLFLFISLWFNKIWLTNQITYRERCGLRVWRSQQSHIESIHLDDAVPGAVSSMSHWGIHGSLIEPFTQLWSLLI